MNIKTDIKDIIKSICDALCELKIDKEILNDKQDVDLYVNLVHKMTCKILILMRKKTKYPSTHNKIVLIMSCIISIKFILGYDYCFNYELKDFIGTFINIENFNNDEIMKIECDAFSCLLENFDMFSKYLFI